jgi:hypothetical protein
MNPNYYRAIKENGMNRKYDADHELITIHGLITPAAWDEEGNVIATAISTFDEEEYLLDSYDMERELMSHIRKEVVVTAEVRKDYGRKIIRVISINGERR